MKFKPILIVPGQTRSIFFEIFFKSIIKKNYKSSLILISSLKLLKIQMKKYNFKKKINLLSYDTFQKQKINNSKINIIDVELVKNNIKSNNDYINNCFDLAFKILKSGYTYKFINGPINKTYFLKKKYLGITEFITNKFNNKKTAMLIYNKNLSVCPLTTHQPIKLVPKKISKKMILEKVNLISNFYKKIIGIKPKIAITGLNPHCESVLNVSEENKIIIPALKKAKSLGFNVFGPFSADTIFQKENCEKYNVILGMYHDQVLGPFKTKFEYDAINITLGLPFYRVTPDHGPNEKMIGKNSSNPQSLIRAIEFLDRS
tara:strand:- start:957 stop:1907 length:951 start_codon:yes stop_codon:yes gene_type:complete